MNIFATLKMYVFPNCFPQGLCPHLGPPATDVCDSITKDLLASRKIFDTIFVNVILENSVLLLFLCQK